MHWLITPIKIKTHYSEFIRQKLCFAGGHALAFQLQLADARNVSRNLLTCVETSCSISLLVRDPSHDLFYHIEYSVMAVDKSGAIVNLGLDNKANKLFAHVSS